MMLTERLKELIGHKVSVAMHTDDRDESTIRGGLREIGDDYIVISDWLQIAGTSTGGKCFIPISKITAIIQNDR